MMPKNAIDKPPDFFPTTRQDEFIFAKIQYLKVGGHEFNSRLKIPNQRVESSGFSRMVG